MNKSNENTPTLRPEVEAVLFHFLDTYNESPDAAIEMTQDILMLEEVAEARARLFEKNIASLQKDGLFRPSPHSESTILDWATTLGRLGIFKALESKALTPGQINDVLIAPAGIRAASKAFHDIDGWIDEFSESDETEEDETVQLHDKKMMAEAWSSAIRPGLAAADTDSPPVYQLSQNKIQLAFSGATLAETGHIVAIQIKTSGQLIAEGLAMLFENREKGIVFAELNVDSLQVIDAEASIDSPEAELLQSTARETLRMMAERIPEQLERLKNHPRFTQQNEHGEALRQQIEEISN